MDQSVTDPPRKSKIPGEMLSGSINIYLNGTWLAGGGYLKSVLLTDAPVLTRLLHITA